MRRRFSPVRRRVKRDIAWFNNNQTGFSQPSNAVTPPNHIFFLSPQNRPLPSPFDADCTIGGIRGIITVRQTAGGVGIDAIFAAAVLIQSVEAAQGGITPALFSPFNAGVPILGWPRGDFIAYNSSAFGRSAITFPATTNELAFEFPLESKTSRRMRGGDDILCLAVSVTTTPAATWSVGYNINWFARTL